METNSSRRQSRNIISDELAEWESSLMNKPCWDGSHGIIDASDAGLTPDEWPMHLRLQCPDGCVRCFRRGNETPCNGAFAGYTYTSVGLNYTVDVIND